MRIGFPKSLYSPMRYSLFLFEGYLTVYPARNIILRVNNTNVSTMISEPILIWRIIETVTIQQNIIRTNPSIKFQYLMN